MYIYFSIYYRCRRYSFALTAFVHLFRFSQTLLIDVLYPTSIFKSGVRSPLFCHVSKVNVVLRFVDSVMKRSQCTEITPSAQWLSVHGFTFDNFFLRFVRPTRYIFLVLRCYSITYGSTLTRRSDNVNVCVTGRDTALGPQASKRQ